MYSISRASNVLWTYDRLRIIVEPTEIIHSEMLFHLKDDVAESCCCRFDSRFVVHVICSVLLCHFWPSEMFLLGAAETTNYSKVPFFGIGLTLFSKYLPRIVI